MKEEDLVLDICSAFAADVDIEASADEFSDVDWGRVVQIASHQKILPIISHMLLSSSAYELLTAAGVETVMFDSIAAAKVRHELLFAESASISRDFSNLGVRHVQRKGGSYNETFYRSLALRTYNDMDFFVSREDLQLVRQCLSARGYDVGFYSRKSSRVMSLSREQRLNYILYPTHSEPFVRLNPNMLLPALKVDIAFEMGWPLASIEAFSTETLSSVLRSRTHSNEVDQVAEMFFHFFDCVLHLYREAMFEEKAGRRAWTGVNLKKFVDVARIWRTLENEHVSSLKRALSGNGPLAGYVYWVAFHTDALLGTDIVADLELAPDGATGSRMFSWVRPGGELRPWNGTMRDRLFSTATFRTLP
ncbi:nucleotidyltransferase family protein [Ensifer sp. IC4062]|nr:nucleotidyltransferase family protein [Ensifer sp. IC4062]